MQFFRRVGKGEENKLYQPQPLKPDEIPNRSYLLILEETEAANTSTKALQQFFLGIGDTIVISLFTFTLCLV